MKTFNTDNMIYVLKALDTTYNFNFMKELMIKAVQLDEDGEGFFCYIQHMKSDGQIEKIPFVA